MSENVRVSCSLKLLAGIDPNQYTVITGIGGFVNNGGETRTWYEPEATAIAYLKSKQYIFYVMTKGTKSLLTITKVEGVERLTTDSDIDKIHTLDLLRKCTAPVPSREPKYEGDSDVTSVKRTARPLNGSIHVVHAWPHV